MHHLFDCRPLVILLAPSFVVVVVDIVVIVIVVFVIIIIVAGFILSIQSEKAAPHWSEESHYIHN